MLYQTSTGNNTRASLKMELPTARPWHCVSEILGPVHHQIIVGIAPDAKGTFIGPNLRTTDKIVTSLPPHPQPCPTS